MPQLELDQTTETGLEQPNWRGLLRLGAVAALIMLLYSIVTMIVLTLLGMPPSTAAECFDMLQQNRILGLLRLDVLTVFVYMPFCYLLFLGIYVALRRTNRAYALLGTVLVFVGITLFLATPSPLSMLVLSDKHALAATDAQKSQLLAAGEAILASDMWHGTGAIIGSMLLQIGALLISIIMLRGKAFGKATAYVGILTHGLDLLHLVLLLSMPQLGEILMAVAGTLYLIWFPLVGLRLFKLGQINPSGVSQDTLLGEPAQGGGPADAALPSSFSDGPLDVDR
jgi:hypothetical protein